VDLGHRRPDALGSDREGEGQSLDRGLVEFVGVDAALQPLVAHRRQSRLVVQVVGGLTGGDPESRKRRVLRVDVQQGQSVDPEGCGQQRDEPGPRTLGFTALPRPDPQTAGDPDGAGKILLAEPNRASSFREAPPPKVRLGHATPVICTRSIPRAATTLSTQRGGRPGTPQSRCAVDPQA